MENKQKPIGMMTLTNVSGLLCYGMNDGQALIGLNYGKPEWCNLKHCKDGRIYIYKWHVYLDDFQRVEG